MTAYGLDWGQYEYLVTDMAAQMGDYPEAQAFIRDSLTPGTDSHWFSEYLNEAISAYGDGADARPGVVRELIDEYMKTQYGIHDFIKSALDWERWAEWMGYEE